MRKLGALGCALVLSVLTAGAAGAQQATVVSGTVTSAANAPIPGASVAITAMGIGTVANEAGQYSFVVPAARSTGQTVTVIARRIGFRQATATVTLAGGAVTQNFTLEEMPTQLQEVVTTALGVEKSKRSIGYAQQSVDSSALTRTRDLNIANTLGGKVAGLTVTSSTSQGGAAKITLRGQNSITNSNNEPLYVVDGIPIDNSNFAGTTLSRGYGGYDYGNAAQDINPDDIAEISVLKGAAAAAIYGYRGANGAIIITTKTGKGSRGFTWNASSNTTFESPLRLPEYQNTWGQGFDGVSCDSIADKGSAAYQECGFSYVDGNYGGVNDGVDESWGPRLDGRPRSQFSFTTPGAAEVRPWIAHPNNVKSFFQTGRTQITNVATQGANDRANFRLSFTNQDVSGIVPNNTYRRFSGSLNAGATITSKLQASGEITYTNNQGLNRPGTGYDEANPMMGFVWFGRQVDIAQLKHHYVTPDGEQISWNYSYHNNPWWNQYMNSNRDDRDRVIGSAQATYTFAPWLKGMVRSGTDFYRDFRNYNIAAGWIGGLFDGGDYSQGGFQETTRFVREQNSDFLLSANHGFLNGRFGTKLDFGGSQRTARYRANGFGTDQLIIPGVYNIGNSAKPVNPGESYQQRQINSLYSQADLSWNDYLFLNATARNDWSSTLPKGNNSYFYPSASLSYVFTDALPMLTFGNLLNSGKLRAALARVGNGDTAPYSLQIQYSPSTNFGTPGGPVGRFPVPNTLPNKDLMSESTISFEVGTELQFFQNRVNFDGTYYNKASTNQILSADISRASGFTAKVLNAGRVTNKGTELQLGLVPVQLGNGFTWNTTLNYAQNRSRVESLYPNLQTVLLGSSNWGATVEARVGEPFGAIYGTKFKRNAQGQLLLRDGLPQASSQKGVLGHYNPQWIGSINNEMRFKSLDLSFLVDAHKGGQVYSSGIMWASYSGQLKETENRDQPMVVAGIDEASGSANTTKVSVQDYYHSLWPIQERWVFDASFVKLREVRLGYRLPADWGSRVGVKSINAAVVGRNLALWSKVKHIDPETAFSTSNQQGIEMGQLPSVRSVGFQITVTP
ncbi:MAG TPA: SusC/RagA family TonB-linked outer membrane protein [Gemmatimonadaceae bacterium]